MTGHVDKQSRGESTRIRVEVQPDHLAGLTKMKNPSLALEELVWNSLDSDASIVEVRLDRNPLGGIQTITVSDDGHGIAREEAISTFGRLGGSWKKDKFRTRGEKRMLHGRHGKGRFRAFALGTSITWTTRYKAGSDVRTFEIRGDRRHLTHFEITPESTIRSERTGTSVEIQEVDRQATGPLSDGAVQYLNERLGLYLLQYPDVRVSFDGKPLDPSRVIKARNEYPIKALGTGAKEVVGNLTVIEWKVDVERALFLCDTGGFALVSLPPGIQAPGFNFTAYLSAELFTSLAAENKIELYELYPDAKALIETAKLQLRTHFRKRAAAANAEVLEKWKREGVYPYSGEAKSILERTEREVFDVCAIQVNEFLPSFDEVDPVQKQLSLRLIKTALEGGAGALTEVFGEVLKLPPDRLEEFAKLLRKTSLSALIAASKVVTDRLDFLRALQVLLFEKLSKKTVLERTQLHRILASQTWVFGEEFSLAVDDEPLEEVLRKHLYLLGRAATDSDPVEIEGQTTGIVDLMLSKVLPQARPAEREHLIIELKRPSVVLGLEEIMQIEKYAFAIANDERFRDTKTRWVFWLVGNELHTNARRKARQKDRPEGVVHQDDELRITIWAKSWSQIVQECEGRMKFFQDRLHYSASRDGAIQYLKETYEKYLPAHLAKPS